MTLGTSHRKELVNIVAAQVDARGISGSLSGSEHDDGNGAIFPSSRRSRTRCWHHDVQNNQVRRRYGMLPERIAVLKAVTSYPRSPEGLDHLADILFVIGQVIVLAISRTPAEVL